jgi:excisionase family DNA binding protein
MTETYLTVAQVASRWNLSGQSVRRKITAGKVPAIRAPGSHAIRVPASFVAEHEASFSRTSAPITASSSTTI